MNTQPQLIHIRGDDIPLLLGLLWQRKIAELYDREVGAYTTPTGGSGGWRRTIWWADILSQGDRTKYTVAAWVRQHHAVLMQVTGPHCAPSDCNDKRLRARLKRWRKPRRWARCEAALWAHRVEVDALSPASLGGLVSAPVERTTACGLHEIVPGGVRQRGPSKDQRPDLGQWQLMTVARHPCGPLAATEVVPGQTADDGWSLPIMARPRAMIGHTGVLEVGETKMAALATRGQLAYAGDYSLPVAPRPGEMAQWSPRLSAAAVTGQPQTVVVCHAAEGGAVIGCGDACARPCPVALPGGAQETRHAASCTERGHVSRADAHQAQHVTGLEERLTQAVQALCAVTPAPGRGRRQHVPAESWHEAIQPTLATPRVAGLLHVEARVEEHRETRLVGRGRSGANRPTREVITRRYVLTAGARAEAAIATHNASLGWRVPLTPGPTMVSLESCVTHSRGNGRGERNDHRLQSAPLGIGPLCVRKDDQIIGKTSLLPRAARVESLLACEVARGLHTAEKTRQGLHAGLPTQQTATPTAPTLLAAIVRCEIPRTLILGSPETTTPLTPLPALLVDVLRYLPLPLTLYSDWWDISTFDISIFGK